MQLNFKLFVVAALLLSASPLMAQQPEGDTVRHHSITIMGDNLPTFMRRVVPAKAHAAWSVGPLVGITTNNYSINVLYAENVKYSDKGGFTSGVQCRWHALGWLALRADLALVQKNYSCLHAVKPSGNTVVQMRTTTNSNYIDLPLVVELSLGNKFRIYADGGAYVGYWAWSHIYGESLSMDFLLYDDNEVARFDEAYEFDSRRDNRFDGGLVAGVGIATALGDKLSFNAEWRLFYGLTDTQKNYMAFQMPRYNTTSAFQLGISWNL